MFTRVLSFTRIGIEAHPIDVEVDVSSGIPTFDIVGLPGSAVREARERVRAAIRNSGYTFPPRRITVNLAPADLRKDGSGFDLPIALGILAATGQLPPAATGGLAAAGQLALDGRLRSVAGVLAMAAAARRNGVRGFVTAAEAAAEGAVAGVPVYPAPSLRVVVNWLLGVADLSPAAPNLPMSALGSHIDLSEIKGQAMARRALEVAAAGGHHLLFSGPPGVGKSMLARCLPGILPPLHPEEALEVTQIYSAAGLSPGGLMRQRPFRAPHHSASRAAVLGGGRPPVPGEISLAHRGVLFLDELSEFNRDTLEALRQPLADGVIHLARADWRISMPARCQMVAACNPCPCGFWGDGEQPCTCQSTSVARYQERLSGPIVDRIDLRVSLRPVPPTEWNGMAAETSQRVATRVAAARERQYRRYKGRALAGARAPAALANAELDEASLQRFIRLPSEAELLLRQAFQRWHFSLRARDRVLRVARTVADLAGRDDILAEDIAEALQYRTPR